jgi:hypothetical protein
VTLREVEPPRANVPTHFQKYHFTTANTVAGRSLGIVPVVATLAGSAALW